MSRLLHRTVYEDLSKISKVLPFTEALQKLHLGGSFPLVEDPNVTKRATLIGMFVLRPASNAFTGPVLDENGLPVSLSGKHLDWVYNVKGLDGGWIIANANSVDAYRLALQYGASDAVIAGSNAASIEGVPNEHGEGYLWQAYCLGEWAQLKSQDNEIAAKIAEQRKLWQDLGYLSSRKYPATIIFTWSGLSYAGSKDFLSARVFKQGTHPDGEKVEIYIITSELGAVRIRERAHEFNLQDVIDEMLIVVPPPASSTVPLVDNLSSDIDIALIPNILYDKYGMKIVNHDGGQSVLRAFCRAGAMSQMNITLCRHTTQKEVVESSPRVQEGMRSEVLSDFESKIQHFFSSPDTENTDESTDNATETTEKDSGVITSNNNSTKSNASNTSGKVSRSIPQGMPPVCVICDDLDDVAVVTFYTKDGFDFDSVKL